MVEGSAGSGGQGSAPDQGGGGGGWTMATLAVPGLAVRGTSPGGHEKAMGSGGPRDPGVIGTRPRLLLSPGRQ